VLQSNQKLDVGKNLLRDYCTNTTSILQNSRINDDNKMVYFITFVIGVFGLIIHLGLLLFFYKINIIEMAYFNIFSIAMWSLGLYFNYNGLHTYAINSFNIEVLLHSVFATMYMGIDSGFQFYLWAISALYILDFKLPYIKALAMSLLFIMLFAILYLLFDDVDVHYEYIHILNFVNIIIAGAPLLFALTMIREIYNYREFKLAQQGMIDSLTNLYNRSYIFKKVIHSINQSDTNIVVVMCDIDHFKSVNDNYGHAEGDYVLKKVSALLKEAFRESDTVVRWGGEEFLIILNHIDIQQAYKTIDAVRKKIFTTIHIQDMPLKPISLSFGIAEFDKTLSLEEVIAQADEALYHSKNSGRNKVSIFK